MKCTNMLCDNMIFKVSDVLLSWCQHLCQCSMDKWQDARLSWFVQIVRPYIIPGMQISRMEIFICTQSGIWILRVIDRISASLGT